MHETSKTNFDEGHTNFAVAMVSYSGNRNGKPLKMSATIRYTTWIASAVVTFSIDTNMIDKLPGWKDKLMKEYRSSSGFISLPAWTHSWSSRAWNE